MLNFLLNAFLEFLSLPRTSHIAVGFCLSIQLLPFNPARAESFMNCTNPQFNSTGSKLYYSCKSKLRHEQYQVYELDLVTRAEKRLTFNDGDSLFPLPYRDQVFYFSNTDNRKRAALTGANNLAFADLFSLNLVTKEIEALTSENLNRSSAQISRFSIYFSETNLNTTTWHAVDLETKRHRLLRIPKEVNANSIIQISKNDWILISTAKILRWNEISKTSELLVSADIAEGMPRLLMQNQDGALIKLKDKIKLKSDLVESNLIWITAADICPVKSEDLDENVKSFAVNPMNSEQVALTLVQGPNTRIEIKSLKIVIGSCGKQLISSKLE